MNSNLEPIPPTTSTTLVIGGHGKTGRRVARRLADRGRTVRSVSRSTAPAFDWNDRHTWAGAHATSGPAR